MQVIDSFRGEYRWLSNFQIFQNSINYEGQYFYSVENAYQAAKTINRDIRKIISDLTPSEAKQLGKEINIRIGWDLLKLKVMEDLVLQKFTLNEDLRRKLVATGDAMLIEGNNWGDKFWGVCNGEGENHLGKILMNVRKHLS